MQLSILIISYNTRELALRCLTSIFVESSRLVEMIVVDNGSTDRSANVIAKEFSQVRVVPLDQNIGFAAGNNLAAREATAEWLLLLNPDTVVLDGAIDKLYAFAQQHPEASIFGGRTVFANGSLNPGSCWRRPTLWSVFCIASGLTALFPKSRIFARESYGPWKRDSVRQVDIVSGCFFLIRKKVWDKLGGFDPAFFMYGEEADLCLRAKKLGYTCLICPDAMIVHYGGASEKVRADKMVRLFRAKALLFDRHWGARSRWFGIRCLDLWALTRVTALSAFKCLRPQHTDSFQTWRVIWSRRAEWRKARISALPAPRVEFQVPRDTRSGKPPIDQSGVPEEDRSDYVSIGS